MIDAQEAADADDCLFFSILCSQAPDHSEKSCAEELLTCSTSAMSMYGDVCPLSTFSLVHVKREVAGFTPADQSLHLVSSLSEMLCQPA